MADLAQGVGERDTDVVREGIAPRMAETARVLVVDDSLGARRKLSLAVRALGSEAEEAEDGEEALARLEEEEIDLVLLDIVMPEIDGFEVLRRIARDSPQRQVPVIVVSDLDEPDEIARAIELGAADFLPKNFNATILRARMNACLAEARRRAEEQETLEQIRRLTAASEALDSDVFNPRELDIGDLAARPGALGVLSRVLLNKSILVYNRRQAQAQQIRTLVGILLLLLIGACFGIKPALASLSLAAVGHPLGVGLVTMGLTAVILLVYAAVQRKPLPRPGLADAAYIALLGILAPLLPQVLLFWVAKDVPSVTIAIFMSIEAFMVFVIAGVAGIERLSARRFLGVVLGLCGVAIILMPELTLRNTLGPLLITLCIPAAFAGRTILLGTFRMQTYDPVAFAAIIYMTATIILLLLLGSTQSFPSIDRFTGEAVLVAVAFSIAEAIGAIALITLVRHSGPVFAGQKSFTVAIGGVLWSVVLLGSVLTVATGLALLLLLAGLLLVAKRADRAALYRQPSTA